MSVTVNPATLIAGTLGAPILGNALGRMFITPKANIATETEADAELRRLIRNFAIYNGVVAVGLGYASSRVKSEGWRSAAIGGSIGTGLTAALLAAALLTGPAVEPKPAPQIGPNTGYGYGPARPASWTSSVIGYR